jgi:hypothetical protein
MKKEFQTNEGGTVWRDRKVRLLDCITQKTRVMHRRDVWEEICTDFEACDGKPAKGT